MTDSLRRHTHTGAYTILRNAAGHILLIRKTRGPYTGAWDLPGGRIEWGESPETAARRELQEETGIALPPAVPLTLIATLSHTTEWQPQSGEWEALHHLGMIYRADLPEPYPDLLPQPENGDADEAQWFAIESLSTMELTPFALRIASACASR